MLYYTAKPNYVLPKWSFGKKLKDQFGSVQQVAEKDWSRCSMKMVTRAMENSFGSVVKIDGIRLTAKATLKKAEPSRTKGLCKYVSKKSSFKRQNELDCRCLKTFHLWSRKILLVFQLLGSEVKCLQDLQLSPVALDLIFLGQSKPWSFPKPGQAKSNHNVVTSRKWFISSCFEGGQLVVYLVGLFTQFNHADIQTICITVTLP